MTVLVLDAMGVIYENGNDIDELLVPFIAGRSPTTTSQHIKTQYRLASLGELSADEFWVRVGIDPCLEPKFLSLYSLRASSLEFLRAPPPSFDGIVVMTNDIERWSKRRGASWSMDTLVDCVFVSSSMGLRKPNPDAFRHLLSTLGRRPSEVLFIDDRVPNLDTARSLGMMTAHLENGECELDRGHRKLDSLMDLHRW